MTEKIDRENRQRGRGYNNDNRNQRGQDQRGPPGGLQFGEFQGRQWNRGTVRCDHCGRTGHEHTRCWQLHPEQRPRNRQDRRTDDQRASATNAIPDDPPTGN